MQANPFLGVVFHAVGGLAAGSFYLPLKGVRKWSWESSWLVNGFFSWIIAPFVAAWLINPRFLDILYAAPRSALLWTYVFGVLWGIGGLTFGLSMRYLGLSLGYALALGFCAAFGTIIPPLFDGSFAGLVSTLPGGIVLLGVGVCLGGIAICGRAGALKERELSDEQKAASVREFNFLKGLWIAILAGVMSACMAFAFAAGKPILETAQAMGANPTFANTPVLVVALLGGFTTNCAWCLYLNLRNGSYRDYVSGGSLLPLNYLLSAAAGITWYLQFFFYGMGTTKMGRYDFSSWTIHMAFIIVFSNLWGIGLKEWKGTSPRTHAFIAAGIAVLIASVVVVGIGNAM